MNRLNRHIAFLLVALLSILGTSTVAAQAPAGSKIDNICSLRYSNEGGVSFNIVSNVATVVVTAQPVPVLTLTKAASSDTVALGDLVSYTIVVRNDGTVALTGVALTDVLDGSSLQPVSVSSNARLSGLRVTYVRDTLPVGQSDIVTIVARVLPDAPAGATVLNVVRATAREYGSSAVQAEASIVTKSPGGETGTHPQLNLTKAASRDTIAVRDTVMYLLTIENAGDVTLHGVIVTDTLSSELSGISVSGNATMGGPVVMYRRDSLSVGERDTIRITARVVSTTAAGRRILNRAYAAAAELGSSGNIAEATIVVRKAIAPPAGIVRITKRASADTILVGQNVQYSIVVQNVSTITAHNILVVDTLSSKLLPVSIRANATLAGQLVTYRRDSLMALQSDTIVVEVQVPADRPHNELIPNAAYVLVNGLVADSGSAAIRTKVKVSDQSCVIGIQVIPPMVVGNGISAARIEAFVADGSGRPKPDGTPVHFRTDVGTFSNGLDSIIVPTKDGIAVDSLRALIISNNIVRAHASVSVSEADICNASSSVEIIFYPGAIAGQVVDNSTKQPVEGGLVEVFSSTGQLVARMVTGPDGRYIIPVPSTDSYRVVVTVKDQFGIKAPVSSLVPVLVPGTGGLPPVLNRSFISGRVYFIVSGRPIVAPGIKVLLSRGAAEGSTKTMTSTGFFPPIDSAVTDSTGLYVFADLPAGTYTVSILDRKLTGSETTTLPDSGRYVLNVNIAIVLNPSISLEKKGPARAVLNDTATYTIDLSNTGRLSATNSVVIDSLDRGMRLLAASTGSTYDSLAHTVRWNLGRLDSIDGPAHRWSGWVRVRFTDSVHINQYLLNRAVFTSDETLPQASDVQTYVYKPEIQITKTALKRVVEVGDAVSYVIRVTNATPDITFRQLELSDRIPFGFSYVAGSAVRDSVRIADPVGSRLVHFVLADSLKPNQTIQLTYRLMVGAGGLESDGINVASVTALNPDGRAVHSSEVSERVEVRLGLFTDHGIIIGKVFFDQNRNAYQDEGEEGVKGIELILENGTRVITGDDGKYSVPDIEAGQHVIHVRRSSVPKNSILVAGYNQFAGDAASRFVHVPVSGIARADFYLADTASKPAPQWQLRQSVARIGALSVQRRAEPRNLVFFEDERPALMRLSGVTFEVAKATLRPEAYPVLQQLGHMLRELPEQSVLIAGHTDSVRIRAKEFKDNKELSIARANSVKSYLVTVLGCNPAQIATAGYGETRPTTTNRTPDGRALNRRVEFDFSGSAAPMKKRDTLSVLFSLPIRYDGSAAISRLEIQDEIDPTFVIVPESGRLGDRPIMPRIEKGHLVWVIDSIGRTFESTLRYRANVLQPGTRTLELQSRTVKIKATVGDSAIVCSDTLLTTTGVAVAVRGNGVNFVLSGVLFDVAKASLRPAAQSALEVAGLFAQQNRSSRLVVEGHTDSTPLTSGEYPSNIGLSLARARTVAALLTTAYGISRDRIAVAGYGEFRPTASNATREGRQLNRRAEIRILRDEFIDGVMPDGGADSSAFARAAVQPDAGRDRFDSAGTQESGSRFTMLLEIQMPQRTIRSAAMVLDTLPAGWSVDRNSIRGLHGIDSISVAGNVVMARCSARDTLAQLMFNVETGPGDAASHTFVVVRNAGTAQAVVERARPIFFRVRQKEQ